jgi:glycosyltransferase involved in cell wall biosynthesis
MIAVVASRIVRDMRLLVFDNALIDESGHHWGEDYALFTTARQRGIAARFLANQRADPALLQALDGAPAFRHSPYAGHGCGAVRALVRMRRLGADFAEDCGSTIGGGGLRPGDAIFLPNAASYEIFGLFLWLRALPRRERPPVFANFVQPWFLDLQRRRYSREAVAYALAMRALGTLLEPERLVAICGTEVMATRLGRLSGRDVGVFPLAKFYPDGDAPPVARRFAPGDPVTVAFLGGVDTRRPEKGGGLLPDLIDATLSARPATRFILHLDPDLQPPEAADRLRRQAASPAVTLVTTPLSRDAYFELLGAADIILMPYRAEDYWAKTSGILCEASALGKVVVVPDGTWLATMLAEAMSAGRTFPEYSASSVTEALVAAIDGVDALSALAAERADRCRREHSVGRFLDLMLERLPVTTPEPRSAIEAGRDR